MVPALKLTEEDVLERLKKILKGVSVVPHMVPECRADNPPPAVSCFISVSTFLHSFFIVGIFSFVLSTFCLYLLNLSSLIVLLTCRNWGVTLLTRSPLMTTLQG
jgi:hypothetical protein